MIKNQHVNTTPNKYDVCNIILKHAYTNVITNIRSCTTELFVFKMLSTKKNYEIRGYEIVIFLIFFLLFKVNNFKFGLI